MDNVVIKTLSLHRMGLALELSKITPHTMTIPDFIQLKSYNMT